MSYKKGDIVELIKPKDVYRIIKKRPYGYDVRHIYTNLFECVSESEIRSNTIDEQTIMFWNLQLQFMERSFESLKDVYKGLRYGSMYVQNLHTGKMDRLLYQYVCSEEDRLCLATHLAVQLSGIEE